jgi:hypothetical protein
MTADVKPKGLAALDVILPNETLDRMREDFAGLSCETKDGYEEVRKAIRLCVKTRSEIDAARKKLNEEALKWQRTVNAEAKRITEQVEAIESPLVKMKEAVDAEAERKRKELEAKHLAFVNGRMAEYLTICGEACGVEVAETAPDSQWADMLREGGERNEKRKAEAAAAAEAERLVREKIAADLQAARAEAQALREQAEKERAELDALRAEKRAAEAKAAAEAEEALRLQRNREAEETRRLAESKLRGAIERVAARKPTYLRELDDAYDALARFADVDAQYLYGDNIEEAKRALIHLMESFKASMKSIS